MAPDGIVEPVDIAANGLVGFLAGVEDGPPDELGFQGLKERLHHGVVVAISLAGHRDQDVVLAELDLIVDRAILAATIRMVDQPCCRTAHGQGFAQSGESQVAMQPVACCPADDPACEQIDDNGEIQPAFAGPNVGDGGAPLLVGTCCREVLIRQVRRDRPSVVAVRGPLDPPLLPSPEAVVAHQPGYPAATDREAAIPQFPRHSGTAIGAVRQGKGRPDMCQQHHVVTLAAAGWPTPPGEIAALTNTKHTAQAMDGEFRFRPIDEREPHRLPSRAKKAVAFFRMSRSWRRVSFSRRSLLNSAVRSLSAADGSTARRSRLRPIQRTSVDSPIPRSPAISRCVRPLVCTRRTASSSNSFVNRRCCVIEFLIAHGELSTFPKQDHVASISKSCSTSVRTSRRGRFSATRVTTPRPTARRHAGAASVPPSLTERTPPQSRLSFPKSSTRGAPASSKASAKSSASNGSPYAARRPPRTSPPSSPSPACLSWSNPSTPPSLTESESRKVWDAR